MIEAGFPVASPGDFDSVKEIAREIRGSSIAGLARALEKDIEVVARALEKAASPRIHIFLSTSKTHREHKLQKNKSEIIKMATDAVRFGKKFCDDIEFSPEDASRTEQDFLFEVIEAVIDVGAKTVNIPDTVGYAVPDEFGELISSIKSNVSNINKAIISVHCHNDLGMAVANRVFFGLDTRIDTKQIMPCSKLVSSLTGFFVQRNKAIVGKNAFAHESGVHQDGFLKKKDTYEIMNPKDIGLEESELVLGKHSGRNALSKRIEDLGYKLTDGELKEVFKDFKILADEKKDLFEEDIHSLIQKQKFSEDELITYKLESLKCSFESGKIPEASVVLTNRDGKKNEATANGDGPVDSICNAIDSITGLTCKLIDYQVMSKTKGRDAQGEVTIRVVSNNREVLGKGVGVNTIEASGLAYINAINKLLFKAKPDSLECDSITGP